MCSIFLVIKKIVHRLLNKCKVSLHLNSHFYCMNLYLIAFEFGPFLSRLDYYISHEYKEGNITQNIYNRLNFAKALCHELPRLKNLLVNRQNHARMKHKDLVLYLILLCKNLLLCAKDFDVNSNGVQK